MRQSCSHCRAIILGAVTVVEISRRSARGPELDRFLMCAECGERVRLTLSRREELVNVLKINPSLVTIDRGRPA